MLRVSLPELSYCRVLAENPDQIILNKLKQANEYVFVVGYENWSHPDFEVINKSSAVINLGGDIDNVFQRFHATCRNEIRRTFREDQLEFVKEISDWEAFYAFHKQCEQERNWIPAPREELQNSLAFGVKYDGHWIAGMTCYHDEDLMRIGRIFSRRKSDDLADYPGVIFSAASRRIIYEYCQWGIANGKKFLDMGGVDPDDPTKKGITKFKMYFGSEIRPTYLGRYESPLFTSAKNTLSEQKIDIT